MYHNTHNITEKGLAARFWEELLIAIVGEQFDVGNEICGAKLSVRFSEDVISLWNRNADNTEATEKIRDLMIRLMRIPAVRLSLLFFFTLVLIVAMSFFFILLV